ncbi:hypothetical protein A3H26_02030 [candidate division WWE3 bacterium RIFCSPLOWO2_12_FULL_36_10]|uniref:Uncharacterized protein n=1 Tax=candidate division WWE3 bacterium RIFCSPLOWO2_12_FULL_36_10 TaxID=1802630 RepID=A0A1F4VKF0_UNCKA|nr:MAG: hypothetical protein A3H26_02030 [candidate division WWE3 bacterium RIFCSPLOWO2_12_FULL_36_10]
MTVTSNEYAQRLALLKAIAAEKKLRDTKEANWKAKAIALLTKLQQDTAGLLFLGVGDITDLLETLFTKKEFPEAQEVEVLHENKESVPVTAYFLYSLEVGMGDWSISVWSWNNKIKIFVRLLAK